MCIDFIIISYLINYVLVYSALYLKRSKLNLLSDAKYFFNAYSQPCKYLMHSVLQSFSEGQKFVRGGQTGDYLFTKKPIKSAKTHFF